MDIFNYVKTVENIYNMTKHLRIQDFLKNNVTIIPSQRLQEKSKVDSLVSFWYFLSNILNRGGNLSHWSLSTC